MKTLYITFLFVLFFLYGCDSRHIYLTGNGNGANTLINVVEYTALSGIDSLHRTFEAYGTFLQEYVHDNSRIFKITGIEHPDSLDEERVNTFNVEFPINLNTDLPITFDLEDPVLAEFTYISYNEKLGEVIIENQVYNKGIIAVEFFTSYRITGTFEVRNAEWEIKNGTFDLIGVYY